ncbi:type II/IV secretion system protein [Dokdonella fugitiva]|uniref:Type II/IV secretion system protein n=2 Tax=Dokdonella fugitiva TaxID=328517 RepID=A0A4R2IKA2_9GAMM|nr:type II/IV secretion system protein [Dokdonella fugitiva]
MPPTSVQPSLMHMSAPDHGPTIVDILDERQRRAYEQALSRERGLILAVGPTNSGKAALLYHGMRMLRRLRGAHVPMATIEWVARDRLDDAMRVVVSSKDGVTFDSALKRLADDGTKAFLVGEIPDYATAMEAVRLTTQRRRLILSTVHTLDAPHALQRLRSIGVPVDGIGESVVLVFALRAVRKLCPECREPLHLPPHSLEVAGYSDDDIAEGVTLWRPNRDGCVYCTNGFRGRRFVCQMLPMTDGIRGALVDADIHAIRRTAMAEGMRSLRKELLDAARAGDVWIADVDDDVP